MKREIDNLRLDYEYCRDFLYSSLGAFFAIVIALTITTNEGMRLFLYAALVVVGIISITTIHTQNKRYRLLRNFTKQ